MRIKKFFNITFVFLKKNKELLHKSVLRIGSTHQTTTEQDFGPALCIKTAGRSQNPALRDRISPWQEWNIHLRISWPAVLS